ncbi:MULTISPECIES: hypothetical protein [Bacillus]|uniref:hypothetical protein n=1 Tax=Bacillus TaxID=1386 RepID=UPI0009C08CA3|nr:MULTISPECIES: hypothetical protein [Bacillus cereus group]PDZ89621.1 hypothetical protein CON47_21725 [Bacillus thuringiensis]HDR3897007.1 hypothetical protein [Bacillus cereus]
MEEILVQGFINEDLKRLGVNATRTYGNEETPYQVYELTDKEFEKLSVLCMNEDDNDEHWQNGGWRWCTGSNQPIPTDKATVKHKELVCWVEPIEVGEESYKNDWHVNLLEYLDIEMGCTAFTNVCAVAKDLAKYNNMTMAELFKKYQG